MSERFPETSWTLLAKAREQCDEGARAREDFARRYYRPVREFLMLLVKDAEKAQELSQEFFKKLSGPAALFEHADREKGRPFREYLQETLRNLVRDQYRRNSKQPHMAHPDQARSPKWEIPELTELPRAEAAFHYEWVKVTLAEALTRVRVRCLRRQQAAHLALFEARYFCDRDAAPSWSELGARYGMDQKTARDRADTVIRQFRIVLRDILRNEITVPGGGPVTEAAIDKEIKALLSPLKD